MVFGGGIGVFFIAFARDVDGVKDKNDKLSYKCDKSRRALQVIQRSNSME
jgi:hypothetical protein